MINYDKAQMEAICSTDTKILCLAGAGSGKTRTLIERISRLVSQGVSPEHILCMTFTNAAAFEMKSRFAAQNTHTSATPEFRTFHSFCYDILISNTSVRLQLGYSKVPSIADEAVQKRIFKQACKQTGVSLTVKNQQDEANMTELERYNYRILQKSARRLMKKENVITYDELIDKISTLL